MLVNILGPNLIGCRHQFHVHAAGCRDCGQPKYDGVDDWIIEVDNLEEAVTAVYEDIMWENDEPWSAYAGDFKVFPCCDLADIANAS